MTSEKPDDVTNNINAFNKAKDVGVGVAGKDGLPAFKTDIAIPREIFDAQKEHYLVSDGEFIFFKPLANDGRCHGCHSAKDKTRGMIVIKSPMKEALAAVGKTKKRLFYFALFLGLTSEAFLFLVLRKTILLPLGKLSKGVKLLQNGELDHRVALDSKDEIGELALHFNEMAGSIEASHVDLEKAVAQKTTELSVIAELSTEVFKGNITFNSIVEHCLRAITDNMGFEYAVFCLVDRETGILTHEITRGTDTSFCDLQIYLASDHPFAISLRQATPAIKKHTDIGVTEEFKNLAIIPLLSHQRKRCREVNLCTLGACPAFDSTEERCWLIEDTLCRSPQSLAGKEKIYGCLHCTAFPVLGILIAGKAEEITGSSLHSLKILTSEIGSAIENQRLIEAKKEDISKLLRLNDVSVESLQVLGDTILETIVSSATAFSNTDASVLWLIGEDGRLHNTTFAGIEGQFIPASLPVEDSFAGTALTENRSIETTSMESIAGFEELVEHCGFLYASSIPLKVRGAALGCITLFKKKDFFMTDSEKAITLLFASQAAAALNTSRLYASMLASEKKYRMIMNDAADAIILFDASGKIIDVNKKAEEFTGYSKAELFMRHFNEFLPPEDLGKAARAFSSTFAEGTGMVNDLSLLRKDSTILPIDVTGSIVELVGQKVLQTIVRDVTERKQTEEVLYTIVEKISGKTGIEFFRSVVTYLARILQMDFVFVGELTEDGGSIRTIAAYRDGRIADNFEYTLAGSPCDTVVGKRACSYPDGVQILFPDDRVLAEMCLESYSGVPLFDSTGGPLGIIVALDRKPISNLKFTEFACQMFSIPVSAELERMQYEKKLISTNEFSDAIFNSSATGIMVLDMEGHVLKLNHIGAEILRTSFDGIIGKNITHIYPESKDMFLAGPKLGKEVAITLPDGSIVPVGFTNSPLYHSSETQEGTVIIFRDLTEVKKLQADLRKKEHFETVSMIISGVAHEVRNPLFGITSIGQILERELELPQHRTLTQALLKEADRMKKLIDDLLLYTKPSNLVMEDVDAALLLEELKHHVSAKNDIISLALNMPPSTTFRVDSEKILKVLLHLLNNAIDAAESSITISARPLDGFIEINIANDGAGIRREHLGKVFDPFFTTKKGGTGLGLPICKKIVEDHGGSIKIESAEGEGTIVTLLLKA
jgi:PAS domain S-box-containing protein